MCKERTVRFTRFFHNKHTHMIRYIDILHIHIYNFLFTKQNSVSEGWKERKKKEKEKIREFEKNIPTVSYKKKESKRLMSDL